MHLYEEHGDDFVAHLNGQFAIALWDSRRAAPACSRATASASGRSSTRRTTGALLFASEVKALFALPGSRRAHRSARRSAEIFTFWAPLAPRTVFEGVRSLPPGHLLVAEGGRDTTRALLGLGFPAGMPRRRAAAPTTAPKSCARC